MLVFGEVGFPKQFSKSPLSCGFNGSIHSTGPNSWPTDANEQLFSKGLPT